ncbi:hypothetical protein DV736_g4689, partial [Chaetothyriales sp. CBS 134916]
MVTISNLFCALTSLQIVLGVFLPISIHYEAASLEARDRQEGDCFKPTQSVDLHYIEEYHSQESYMISVTPSHSDPIYVLTEKFEHLLNDVICTANDENDSVNIVYAFNTVDSMRWAEGAWVKAGLLFVTHHSSCNSAYERALYRAEGFQYDFENLIVVITGRYLPLGDTIEAHTHITLSGGPVTQELKRKLRRRSNLQYGVSKRQSSSSWVIPLDQNWGSREEIITSSGFDLTCVDCSLTGEATVSFTLDVDFGDLPLNSPFKEATLKLEATKAIDGDFNIEITAAADVHAQCSFPGGCRSSSYSVLGKNFRPSKPTSGPGFSLGGWDLTVSPSLGLSVSLDADAQMKVTVPFTIDSPEGSAAWKNFFDGGGNTLDLKPVVKAPILNKEDAEGNICAAVAIGPSASLNLSHGSFPSVQMSIGARLDLPRVSICAALAQHVDSDCDAGDFDEAIKLTGDVGVGLETFGSITVTDINIANFNTPDGDLYKTWNFLEKCYDISGVGSNNETTPINQPPPVSGNSTTTGPPTNGSGNQNLTAPGYDHSLYDCSSVAPSPGGQPCGSVTMICPTAYTWSCGNGQEGVVPPAARIAYLAGDVVLSVQSPPAVESAFSAPLRSLAATKAPNLVSKSVPEVITVRQNAVPLLSAYHPLREGKLLSVTTSSAILLHAVPHLYKLAEYPIVLHVALASQELDFSEISSIRQSGFAFPYGKGVIHFFDPTNSQYDDPIPTESKELVETVLRAGGLRAHHVDGLEDTLYASNGRHAALTDYGLPSPPPPRVVEASSTTSFGRDDFGHDDTSESALASSAATTAESPVSRPVTPSDVYSFVSDTWALLGQKTGRVYAPIKYSGPPDAEAAVFIFGSTGVFIDVLDSDDVPLDLASIGIITARLYRPSLGRNAFLNSIPSTIKKIAVLEQIRRKTTKWGPSYLDLLSSLSQIAGGTEQIQLVQYRLDLVEPSSALQALRAVFQNLAPVSTPRKHSRRRGHLAAAHIPVQNLTIGEQVEPTIDRTSVEQPTLEDVYLKILNQLFASRLYLANQANVKHTDVSPSVARMLHARKMGSVRLTDAEYEELIREEIKSPIRRLRRSPLLTESRESYVTI